MSHSPLRGLERLSEEMRQERQKANIAMQERARLRIEVESLKQFIEKQSNEVNEIRANAEETESEITSLKQTIKSLESICEDQKSSIRQMNIEMAHAKATTDDKEHINGSLARELQDSRDRALALQHEIESFDTRIASKDHLIADLHREIAQLRQKQVDSENKVLESKELLSDHMRASTEVELRLKQAEAIKENYYKLMASHDDLREEFESLLKRNTEMNQKNSECNQAVADSIKQLKFMEESLDSMKRERDRTREEIETIELSHNELLKRVKAESENALAANSKADMALRGRQFLEKQIEELRQAHSESLERESEIESELSRWKDENSTLLTEISSLREKAFQVDAALAQSENNNAMAAELELLRAQLTEVRKQLIRRDVEEEASAMAPSAKSAIEREQNSREAYEAIIVELRTELDRVSAQFHDARHRLDESMSKCARIDQLEMEVQMYKDTAKLTSVESHSIAITASEAVERSVRSAHDKHNILRSLQNVEAELLSVRNENQRYKTELSDEKQKHKVTYLEKLSAERKHAELVTMKSRIEASLDEAKQAHSADLLDLDRAKRQMFEFQIQISELRGKTAEIEKLRDQNTAFHAKLVGTTTEALGREQELLSEVALLKQSKATMQREVDTLRSKFNGQKKTQDEQTKDLQRLRMECDELRLERERYRRDSILKENQRAGSNLHDLKTELEKTVNDFQDTEKERNKKDVLIRSLQVDLGKEKERVSLMKTQLNILDERLRVASQELSVYRSLENYHASIQIEGSATKNSSALVSKDNLSSDPWILTMSLPSTSEYSASSGGIAMNQTQGLHFEDLRSNINHSSGLSLNAGREESEDKNGTSARSSSPLHTGPATALRSSSRSRANSEVLSAQINFSNQASLDTYIFNRSGTDNDINLNRPNIKTTSALDDSRGQLTIADISNSTTNPSSSASVGRESETHEDMNADGRSNSHQSSSASNIYRHAIAAQQDPLSTRKSFSQSFDSQHTLTSFSSGNAINYENTRQEGGETRVETGKEKGFIYEIDLNKGKQDGNYSQNNSHYQRKDFDSDRDSDCDTASQYSHKSFMSELDSQKEESRKRKAERERKRELALKLEYATTPQRSQESFSSTSMSASATAAQRLKLSNTPERTRNSANSKATSLSTSYGKSSFATNSSSPAPSSKQKGYGDTASSANLNILKESNQRAGKTALDYERARRLLASSR